LKGACEGNVLPLIRGEVIKAKRTEERREGGKRGRGEKGRKGGRYGDR